MPMPSLDIATVLLLHKTSLLAGAAVLSLLWWRSGRPAGVAPIAVAMLLLAIGAFLAGLGESGVISPHLWRDTSAGLAVFAYALLFLGMRALDRPLGRSRLLLLTGPLVLGVGLKTAVFDDNLIRASVFHAAACLGNLGAAIGLLRHRVGEPLSSRPALACALGACAVVYGLQVPFLLAGFSTAHSIALGFSATLMLNFAIAALVVSFVRERREEAQRRLSITDALTGTYNRHGFLSLVPRTIEAPGAMALFDLDHFKRINDRFGHAGGDEALVRFAQMVGRRLGKGDVLARLGGEEFVVFLPEGGGGRMERMAQEIRVAVEAAQTPWKGETIHMTTSVGVALATAGSIERDALLAEADEALYRAKGHGRNRVETARTGGEPKQVAIIHRLARRASRAAG